MTDPLPVEGLQPLDVASAAFRSMPVPEPPLSGEMLARLTAGDGPASVPLVPNRRKMMMRLATWSAAAAALLAGGTLFFSAFSAIALADVVKAAEKHSLVKYKMKETFEREDGQGPAVGTAESVTYADLRAPRFRTERKVLTLNGAVESVHYTVQDNAKDRTLRVLRETAVEGADRDPAKADAMRDVTLPRLEATLSRSQAPSGAGARGTILDNLRALESHEDATSSREKVNGRETIRYEIEDGPRTTTLWVDAATKLPVRMKMVQIGNGKLTVDFTDFEWDAKLVGFKDADELFDTTPPAGYTLKDETKGR